jgi:hypothetical protein
MKQWGNPESFFSEYVWYYATHERGVVAQIRDPRPGALLKIVFPGRYNYN